MEKRFYFKKILKDCLFPEGLFEIKDKERNLNLIVEDENNVIKICNLLNEQDEIIKNQEKIITNNNQKLINKYFEELNKLDEEYNTDLNERLKEIEKLKQENQQLKQSQSSKAIEVLEELTKTLNLAKEFCGCKATALDIASATIYNQCIDDIKIIINNQITELKGYK